MNLTYKWVVTGIKIKDQKNQFGETLPKTVFQTYWRVDATNEKGEDASFSGATPFSAETVPAGEFVPFEELTEELVTGWIRARVENDPTFSEHIRERLIKMIESTHGYETSLEQSDLPWTPKEEVSANTAQ